MTDARLPEKWLNDRRVLRLSDPAYRLHVTALLWAVANRTDGVLAKDDLPLLPRAEIRAAGELETAGLWQRAAGGWLLVDFNATQTSAHELAVLENARRADRNKKARQRAAAKAKQAAVPEDRPGELSPGTVPGTAQDRQGQDRQGQAATNAGNQARLCKTCADPLPTDVVVAGWTAHPLCESDWPQTHLVKP